MWAAIAGIVGVIYGISQCSSQSETAVGNPAKMMDSNMSADIAAQGPAPPQSLSAASVTRGENHFRKAIGVEGFSGAMIYSQNCYDALGRHFSWAKLDICGAFDSKAVQSMLNEENSALGIEQTYFESEATAGRYLAAATGAGEEAGDADLRLSDLQKRTSAAAPSTEAVTQAQPELNSVEASRTPSPAEQRAAANAGSGWDEFEANEDEMEAVQ